VGRRGVSRTRGRGGAAVVLRGRERRSNGEGQGRRAVKERMQCPKVRWGIPASWEWPSPKRGVFRGTRMQSVPTLVGREKILPAGA